MPRKVRAYLPGVACHVIQRGNNRDACFYGEQDYRYYLQLLLQNCRRYRVGLHAYVLMTNHVHLLLTPDDPIGISRVMQSLGRNYVQYINKTYRRTGTLWEGRYKASLVDSERYLLACYRYIEMNPVRAGMVQQPGEYVWSSFAANALGADNAELVPHPAYMALGATQSERQRCYLQQFSVELDEAVIGQIRLAASCSMPLGNSRFKAQIEAALQRSLGYTRRGRPGRRSRMPAENE